MKRSKRRVTTRRRSGFGRLSRLVAENNQDRGEVLDALNSIPVTAEDLWCVGEDLAYCRSNIHTFSEGFNGADVLAVVRERFGKAEPEKGSAIFFRFEALVAFLAKESNLKWDDALVAAAAAEPVVPIGDELTFQRDSFLRRMLEFYAYEGTASQQ